MSPVLGDRFIFLGTERSFVSKEISISEEVYRRLERERGDRSIDEFLEELLDDRGTLADVTGQGVFDPGADVEGSTDQDTR